MIASYYVGRRSAGLGRHRRPKGSKLGILFPEGSPQSVIGLLNLLCNWQTFQIFGVFENKTNKHNNIFFKNFMAIIIDAAGILDQVNMGYTGLWSGLCLVAIIDAGEIRIQQRVAKQSYLTLHIIFFFLFFQKKKFRKKI